MKDSVEASRSVSPSSYLSNGASSCNLSISSGAEPVRNLEIISLNKLSSNLETLLLNSGFDCSDAEVVVTGIPVCVHRCILSARSKFFYKLFSQDMGSSYWQEGRRPKYDINELVPKGKVGYEAFMILLGYIYTGKMKPAPAEVSSCVDDECAHAACAPAVQFVVQLMYASWTFQIPELISLFQRRLLSFVDRASVEDVIPILQAGFNCQLRQLVTHCVRRVACSDLDSVCIEKEIPREAAEEIKAFRLASNIDVSVALPLDLLHQKRIRRIHRALDSDDIELVKLLLSESNVTLDDAGALHYAVTYCDCKIVEELLELGLASVNGKNARGYTPLHIAARRQEAELIVSLLSNGASVLEMAADGQSAAKICRRQTRAKDFFARAEQGQETHKGRLCIDVLEREMRQKPFITEECASTEMADDVYMRLRYLENRVACARLLFPTEAKVAMKIANVDATTEFAGFSELKHAFRNRREVDLNETPSVQLKRLRSRMDALTKTVALGRRYFPNCSQVLDKLLEDDLQDLNSLLYSEKGTPDERETKRLRFFELKDEVLKAFTRDKAETSCSGLSSCSSSSFREGAESKTMRK